MFEVLNLKSQYKYTTFFVAMLEWRNFTAPSYSILLQHGYAENSG